MRSLRKELVLLFVVIVSLSAFVVSPYSPAAAMIGVATVTTPSLSTSTTYSPTTTTTLSTTSTTTSTSFSTSVTSTTTTSTSTSTSFSYTSTYSTTTTNTTSYTSYTGTSTAQGATSTTLQSTSVGTSTTVVVSTSETTIAVFPGCLIATATFGSELAPEVQLLRDFRDAAILKTSAGSGFMVAFNSWYYSFSPSVAAYLTTHSFERYIMKGVLYPLVGILKLSSLTFTAASAFPELAAFLSGLVASSLIGAFYLGLPLALVRSRIRRLRPGRAESFVEKSLAVSVLAGIAILIAGEAFAAPFLLVLSTATIVLSTLLLSAAFTSGRISRKLQAF